MGVNKMPPFFFCQASVVINKQNFRVFINIHILNSSFHYILKGEHGERGDVGKKGNKGEIGDPGSPGTQARSDF